VTPRVRFVFDQHVNAPALRQLRESGVDVVHVAEVGLNEADDPDILAWATERDRIVVTRNYRDFAPLVDAYARRGIDFPGVLFYATSVRHSDVGHHVRALLQWIDETGQADRNPVRNGIGWLR
jgi:predicted nuclease of predicted toxin-antitoxin system